MHPLLAESALYQSLGPMPNKVDSFDTRVSETIVLIWSGRRDSNPHGHPLDPKSSASANFATPGLPTYINPLSKLKSRRNASLLDVDLL